MHKLHMWAYNEVNNIELTQFAAIKRKEYFENYYTTANNDSSIL